MIYKNGDKVPVFLHVLDMCSFLYAQVALKVAVIDHYQELNGIIDKRQLNQSLMVTIASTVKSLDIVLADVANAYAIGLKEHLDTDQYITRISSDIYWSLIVDEFPSTIDEDDAKTEDYIEMHNHYAGSLLSIFKGLFQMFCYGEIDLDNFDSQGICKPDFWLSRQCDKEHLQALLKLLQLNNQLLEYQSDIYNHVLNFNLNQYEDSKL